MNANRDPYFKKEIEFLFSKKVLKFNISQNLFSSFDVDKGTKLLLKTLASKNFKRVLDLGCGYGVLGITVKTLDPKREVHCIDRDALALEYTKQNTQLNGININMYGSLGYDNVTEKFNLIVSNIPAKVGESVLTSLLIDSNHFLEKDGIVAIVVVKELEATIEKILNTPTVAIVLKEKDKGHTVFHYQFKTIPKNPYVNAFKRGVYDRANANGIRTVYGLPEFDSLSFNTQFVIKILNRLKNTSTNNVLFCNPRQGHIPFTLFKKYLPQTITLFDRDLLALENTKRNLLLQGYKNENITICHAINMSEISQKIDFAIIVLRDDDTPEITKHLMNQIKKLVTLNGIVLVSGTSTQITQSIKNIKLEKSFVIKDRKKWRAQSVLHLEKENELP